MDKEPRRGYYIVRSFEGRVSYDGHNIQSNNDSLCSCAHSERMDLDLSCQYSDRAIHTHGSSTDGMVSLLAALVYSNTFYSSTARVRKSLMVGWMETKLAHSSVARAAKKGSHGHIFYSNLSFFFSPRSQTPAILVAAAAAAAAVVI